MKKFSKPICLMIVIMMVVSVALTGCGDSEQLKKASESAVGATTAAAAVTTKAEAPKEMQKLTYYSFSDWTGDPKYAPAYEEVVKKFESENAGFKMELQHDPWGTWESKYKIMFAADNAPDVFITNNPDFPTFANGDNLLDIGAVTGTDALKDYFPGVLNMYTWQGKIMGIPFTTDCRVLWYNKEIFKKAGLDPENPPKTWDELKEYAKKCTLDSDGDGKVDVYGFGMELGLKEFPAQALFCASNGSTLKVGDDGSITPNVNTTEFKNYLQLLADMKPFYEPDFATLDHHKVGTLFAQQKVAMAIAGTWIWDMNNNMATDTFYGQALVPKMDENSPNGSYSGGFAICVNKNTKNPAEAVKFAQLLCAPENNARLMSDIPASNGGLAASSIARDAKYATFMKQITYGRQAQPKTLFYAQIDTATYDEVVKAIYGKDTVDQAVKNIEENINTIVKR